MLFQIAAETFGFWVYVLGAIALIFACLTWGIVYEKARRLKLEKILKERGIENIE